jgi:hypothetical protein
MAGNRKEFPQFQRLLIIALAMFVGWAVTRSVKQEIPGVLGVAAGGALGAVASYMIDGN